MKKNYLKKLLCFSLSALFLLSPLNVDAASYMDDNKLLPVASNQTENWPVGPAVGCYSAILIDAETGTILYEKNSHEKMYPASTTKLMTCVLAMEKEDANLNDMVDFSWDAVMTIPRDSSNMGMDAGEKMTLEECLYGILVVSANETANAVAEYVAGDIPTFVEMMNNRALDLGCTDTHFVNPHGYYHEDHYTSAYDLAQIARVFFKSELLSKISRTPRYHWYATEYQPDDFILASTNYFFRGKKECEGLVGSKTGFTDESRNTLVSCAERNGMKLICVIMREETPYQYDDTNLLFDYGFSNFEKVRVCDYETKYTVTDESFFHSDSDVFGDSSPILSMDNASTIILPKTVSFEDLHSSIAMTEDSDKIATVTYDYNGVYLGEAGIYYSKSNDTEFVFDEATPELLNSDDDKEDKKTTYINVYHILIVVAVIIGLFVIYVLAKSILSNYSFVRRRRPKRKRRSKHAYKSGPSLKGLNKKVIYKSSPNSKNKKRKLTSSYDHKKRPENLTPSVSTVVRSTSKSSLGYDLKHNIKSVPKENDIQKSITPQNLGDSSKKSPNATVLNEDMLLMKKTIDAYNRKGPSIISSDSKKYNKSSNELSFLDISKKNND